MTSLIVIAGKAAPLVLARPCEGLRFAVGGALRRDFALYDCFDQPLRRSGRVLLRTGRDLMLLSDDAAPISQKVDPGRGSVPAIASGAVCDALTGLPPLRVLMVQCAGRAETLSVAVLDDMEKTCLRMQVITLSAQSGTATLVLTEPMRGYDRAHQRVVDALLDCEGASRGATGLWPLLMPGVQPYQSKPEVPITADEPAHRVAADLIRSSMSVARQNEAGIIEDIDTEFLHDYRIGLRRIRSVLSLFRDVFPPEETDELQREFSELMAPTGRVRDLDVYLLGKPGFFALVPEALHPGLDLLFARMKTERDVAQRALARHLRSARYTARVAALDARLTDPSGLPPGPEGDRAALPYAQALIWTRYRKVCKLARRIDADTPDDDVHRLRIHCKKLRYLMEFFGPLFPKKKFRKILRPLKGLQDNLGLFNDYSVQQLELSRYLHPDDGAPVETDMAAAVGALLATLSRLQAGERTRVVASFSDFDNRAVRAVFEELFHQPEEAGR